MENNAENKLLLYGIVKDIRIFKWGGFFLLESFDLNTTYQCVVKNYDLNKLKSESYVFVNGRKKESKITKKKVNSSFEIEIDIVNEGIIEVLTSPSEISPINIYENELNIEQDLNFNLRPLSLRHEKNKSIFKIQANIVSSFRNFLDMNNFTSICSPKLVANGAEGGTNVFKLKYFDKEVYLAQSPQFYKQMMCGVFGKVYETAPVFRAEKHNTSRHLNEYTSLDVETILHSSFKELIQLEKNIISYIFEEVAKMEVDIDFLGIETPSSENVHNALILTVAEAKILLNSKSEILYDLTNEEEIEICKYAKENNNTDFVFITNYHKSQRPFYTMLSEDGEHTESFDLLYKGIEITSGSQRKHVYNEYISSLKELDINPESFESYLQTFKYGMPLHGGFVIGLERLTAKICNLSSVKMACLFPRDIDRITP